MQRGEKQNKRETTKEGGRRERTNQQRGKRWMKSEETTMKWWWRGVGDARRRPSSTPSTSRGLRRRTPTDATPINKPAADLRAIDVVTATLLLLLLLQTSTPTLLLLIFSCSPSSSSPHSSPHNYSCFMKQRSAFRILFFFFFKLRPLYGVRTVFFLFFSCFLFCFVLFFFRWLNSKFETCATSSFFFCQRRRQLSSSGRCCESWSH